MVKWHAGDIFAICFGGLILLIGGNTLSDADLMRYGMVMALAYIGGRCNGSPH